MVVNCQTSLNKRSHCLLKPPYMCHMFCDLLHTKVKVNCCYKLHSVWHGPRSCTTYMYFQVLLPSETKMVLGSSRNFAKCYLNNMESVTLRACSLKSTTGWLQSIRATCQRTRNIVNTMTDGQCHGLPLCSSNKSGFNQVKINQEMWWLSCHDIHKCQRSKTWDCVSTICFENLKLLNRRDKM